MKITVKLFATFRLGRFDIETLDFPAETKVGDVIEDLNLPEDKLGIVMVNNKHVDLDRVLVEGETLAIFPLVGGG